MLRQLPHLATSTRNSLQKFTEIRRCLPTSAGAADAESQRIQNLEQKVIEETASRPDNWDDAKPFSEIPGPKPLPIVGNLWRFMPLIGDINGSDPIAFITGFQKYGDIAALRGFLAQNMVFLYKPEDIQTVFRNEGTWPERTMFKSVEHYQSNARKDLYDDLYSLAASNGKGWHKMRTIANPILNQVRSIEMYIPEMDSVAQDFVKRIRFLLDNKKEGTMRDDFINELTKWSLESVSFFALDKRLGCLENNLDPLSEAQKIIDSVHKTFEYMNKIEFQPSLLKHENARNLDEFVKHLDIITNTFSKHIQEAKNSSSKNSKTVLQKFFNIDEKVAIVMAIDLVIGGVDTTSKSSASILYFLACHKKAQDELRKELVRLLPNKDSPLTKETLADAKYLKASIREAFRMGGIPFVNSRTTIKDMVVGGYQIPKGTLVQMCAYQNLFSEQYFPHPREFLPERWLRTNTSETSYRNTHPFVHLPFGFGVRSCIGQRIATMELELLTARIIRNFELEWPHPPAKFGAKIFYEIVDPLKFKVKEVSE